MLDTASNYFRSIESGTVATQEDETVVTTNPTSAEQLSVRERMQRFNRMASETDLVARSNDAATPVRKRSDKASDFSLQSFSFRDRSAARITDRATSGQFRASSVALLYIYIYSDASE